MQENKPEKNRDFLFLIIALIVIVFLALAAAKAVFVIGEKFVDSSEEFDITGVFGDDEDSDKDDKSKNGFSGKSHLIEIGLSSDEANDAIKILESCGIHGINYINEVPSSSDSDLGYFFDCSNPDVDSLQMIFDDNNQIVEVNNLSVPIYYNGEVYYDVSEFFFSEELKKQYYEIVLNEVLKNENVSSAKIDDSEIPPVFNMIDPDTDHMSAVGMILVQYIDGSEQSLIFGLEMEGETIISFSMME